MSADELIRPHDPFSGHETPVPADDTAEPESGQEQPPPPPEAAKEEKPPPAPKTERKPAPRRRAAPRRRRVSKAEAEAAAKQVGK
jgi:hypothetical protein